MKKLFLIVFAFISVISVAQCYMPDIKETTIIFTANPTVEVSESEFSIAKDVKIHFAIGNLQYRPSTGEWRLAPRQFDYVGGHYNGDSDIPNGEYGTIYKDESICSPDTKCWNRQYSASGQNLTPSVDDWVDAFNFEDILTLGGIPDDTTFLIDGKIYRIPTSAELSYLVNNRPKADTLRARAQIVLNTPTACGNTFVNGLLLLPDNWDPKILIHTTIIPDLDGVNGCWNYFDNRITENEWYILEAQGAVFLPAAGNATGRSNSKYNRSGFYWTITPNPGKTDQYWSLEFGGYEWYDNKGNRKNTFPSLESQSKTVRRTIRLCQEITE